MKYAVFVYSVPIDETTDEPDIGVGRIEQASEHLAELIAQEGVQQPAYVLVDGQIDMMEDFLAGLERHA